MLHDMAKQHNSEPQSLPLNTKPSCLLKYKLLQTVHRERTCWSKCV